MVVLAGFPHNSRKQNIEAFVKEQLSAREEWRDLVPFAPNVRSSVVMIKVNSRDDIYDFIRKWKTTDARFNDHPIRARADKSPEQRKANGKVYMAWQYLREKFEDKGVDPDYTNSSVWIGEWEVAKWDAASETIQWLEEGIASAGVVIDRDEAARKMERL